MMMLEKQSSNNKSLAINNNEKFAKNHTSKSAHLVAEIRQRFFENEWPKNKGKFIFDHSFLSHIYIFLNINFHRII